MGLSCLATASSVIWFEERLLKYSLDLPTKGESGVITTSVNRELSVFNIFIRSLSSVLKSNLN